MASPERNPYAILGVPRDAGRDVVAAAYRRLARAHHPDAGAASARDMTDINWAWGVLSDPARRRAWDARSAASHGPSTAHWTAQRSAPRPWQPPAAGWAASGEAWNGGLADPSGRHAAVGCLPISVVVLVLAAIVLLAGLSSGRMPGLDAQTTMPPAFESAAP